MKSVKIAAKFGLPAVPFKKETENHLLIELNGLTPESQAKRPPIDVVLCLDTSPSMNSQRKLPLAKKSAIALIDNLRDGDSLALVYFSGASTVRMPFTKIDANSRKIAVEHINSARAGGGGTNISGAIIDAFNQVRDYESSEDATRRVIFLTDGCPTSGETRDERLVEMASNVPENCSLVTMGYGVQSDNSTFGGMGGDLKTQLLQYMAEAGKGTFYYAHDADTVKSAFASELAGLLSCVAQDVKIKLGPVDSRINLVEVLDNVDTEENDGYITITIPNVLEGEQRFILVKSTCLKQKKAWARAAKVCEIEMTYKDVVLAKTDTITTQAKLSFTSDEKASKEVDKDVQTQIKVLESIKAQQVAMDKANQGDYSGASDTIRTAIDALKNVGSSRADKVADSLMPACDMYGDKSSFLRNVNVLGATTYSMAANRAVGASLMDSVYSTSSQNDMKDLFDAGISDDDDDVTTEFDNGFDFPDGGFVLGPNDLSHAIDPTNSGGFIPSDHGGPVFGGSRMPTFGPGPNPMDAANKPWDDLDQDDPFNLKNGIKKTSLTGDASQSQPSKELKKHLEKSLSKIGKNTSIDRF